MLGRRSHLYAQTGGGGRVALTRRDYQLVRLALTEAVAREERTRPVLERLEDWGRYAGTSARVVVPLESSQLELLRVALLERIAARPVADTAPERRLYDRLLRPRRARR